MPGLTLQQAQSQGFTPSQPSNIPQSGGMTLQQAQSKGFSPVPPQDNSFLAGHPVLKALGDFTGTTGLGKGISQAIFLNFTPEGKQTLSDLQSGKITKQQFDNIVGGGLATNKEVLGSAAQTALTVGTAGLGSPETATANEATGQLIRGGATTTAKPLLTRLGTQIGTGAAIGGTGGAINAYSKGEGAGGIATGAAQGAVTGGLIGGASELATTGLMNSLNHIQDSVYGTAEQQAAKLAEQHSAQFDSVVNDWIKPSTINKPSYKAAANIVSNNPEVGETLTKLGVNPYSHVENGVYDTKDIQQSIIDNAGKKSGEMLRPALRLADASTAPIPATDILTTALKSMENNSGMTPTIKKDVTEKITSMVNDIQQEYPKGLTLENQLDEKINHDANGGYNPIKSNSDNNTAIANRSIANAFRTTLEQNAPKDIGITAFNKELTKWYTAADYLGALNDKKAPVSVLQSAIRYGSKIIGAKTAGLVGGGDIVGELVGYHVGGQLESLIENMTNKTRGAFLEDIKSKTTPEAFQKVEAYIKSVKQNASTNLKLPEGAPLGTSGNPIITPEFKGGESSVKIVPAKKGFPAQNPKTGKMVKTFTSNPN